MQSATTRCGFHFKVQQSFQQFCYIILNIIYLNIFSKYFFLNIFFLNIILAMGISLSLCSRVLRFCRICCSSYSWFMLFILCRVGPGGDRRQRRQPFPPRDHPQTFHGVASRQVHPHPERTLSIRRSHQVYGR